MFTKIEKSIFWLDKTHLCWVRLFQGLLAVGESNHWLRRGLGIVLCGTLTANCSSCHCSLQTDSCTRKGSDRKELSYLLLFPDAVMFLLERENLSCCWK